MFVSKGKRIYILNQTGTSYLNPSQVPNEYKAAGYLQEIPLYLGEDFNFKTSSEFGSPFQGMQEGAVGLTQMIQLLGAAGQGLGIEKLGSLADKSAQSKFSSYQFWKYSSPISFSLTLNFFRGIAEIFDAKKEVFLPTLLLSEIVLPTREGALLKSPGPTMASFINEATSSVRNPNNPRFSIVVGKMLALSDCIIRNAEGTFSNEVDQYGYPIKSTVRIEVSSTTVGTTNMIRLNLRSIDKEEIVEKASEKLKGWVNSLLGGE